MDEELYKEHILDLGKSPHNKGVLSDARNATKYNASCGDDITVYVVLDDRGVVTESSFDGTGCIVSQAAASLLTDHIQGKTVEEIQRITKEDIERMLGVPLNIVRMRCAVLSLDAVQEALQE